MRRYSLATKCLLLFGGAIVLIVLLAAAAPFIRMNALVDEGQLELARQMAATWDQLDREALEQGRQSSITAGGTVEHAGIAAARLTIEQARVRAENDPFVADALEHFESAPGRTEFQSTSWAGTSREYRYARAVRPIPSAPDAAPTGLLLLERRPLEAARLLLLNLVYLASAGSVILGLALLVFYLITAKLILNPVRTLKRAAERVRAGELNTRAEISTHDEFQDLAETFDTMLVDLQANQDQLRSINAALGLKIDELSETNVALYDAAKVKGEFLANVSHELRTPLNSIIGFAELMSDIARSEAASVTAAGEEIPTSLAKRLRYADNIVVASRNLLEMINSLLEMARIEAGKVEMHPERVSLSEVCDGLIGLISPLADRKGIALKLDVADDLPVITTDVKKFQQVIFNFLSNAVKFTEAPERSGKPGFVTLRAERLRSQVGDLERVRVSVTDTGPGIPPEDQQKIFEKFQQLDGGHTREHTGTGLGLAIARELAHLLQGEIQLVSEPGRGSMFSLILPLEYDPSKAAESKLEARFRARLATRRAWT